MNNPRPGRPVLAQGRAVVGIDIGKRTHAATAISPQGQIIAQLASFPNTREGFDRLENEVLRPAGGPGRVLVAMEATGHYWMCPRAELERRGYDTVVLNPIQTNARCNAQIRKTRNDRIDSASIARLVLSGEARASRVPDERTLELRLLTRHRRRLLRTIGDQERFAHTLVDRIFPEYADVFSEPFLPSGEQLIRQVGLAPDSLLQRKDQVRDVLRRTSRGRLGSDTIDQLLRAAQTSIGVQQAQGVVHQQLTSILDFRHTVRAQIALIESELERRVQQLKSPLLSLGISSILPPGGVHHLRPLPTPLSTAGPIDRRPRHARAPSRNDEGEREGDCLELAPLLKETSPSKETSEGRKRRRKYRRRGERRRRSTQPSDRWRDPYQNRGRFPCRPQDPTNGRNLGIEARTPSSRKALRQEQRFLEPFPGFPVTGSRPHSQALRTARCTL